MLWKACGLLTFPMKKKTETQAQDTYLIEAKREGQARSRKLVQEGVRTQESMFFIASELAKQMKVKHRA